MAYDPYAPGSDARAWAGALRNAEFDHYARLSWWQKWLFWVIQKSKAAAPVKTALQLGIEADVLLRFADVHDHHIEEEGTPTPREVKW